MSRLPAEPHPLSGAARARVLDGQRPAGRPVRTARRAAIRRARAPRSRAARTRSTAWSGPSARTAGDTASSRSGSSSGSSGAATGRIARAHHPVQARRCSLLDRRAADRAIRKRPALVGALVAETATPAGKWSRALPARDRATRGLPQALHGGRALRVAPAIEAIRAGPSLSAGVTGPTTRESLRDLRDRRAARIDHGAATSESGNA